MKNSIVIIAGPTASGKSAVSVKLAQLMNTEIVSADSMQVYKGFDIGTAKITEEEKMGIVHHMIDVVDPKDSFNVNDYNEMATAVISEIHKKGKVPIVCGGTGLYINSLIYNFDLKEHKSDPVLRSELEALYEEKGGEYLLDILREFDPDTANTLHPNNYRRIIRAIEFYRVSGTTITQQKIRTQNTPNPYKVKFFVLNRDREILYDRINKRVDKMVNDGLINEVKNLYSQGVYKNATSLQAIGYKEFSKVLSGEMTKEDAIEKIKLESRRYAKRQLTWFRRNEEAVWIDTGDFSDNPEKIAQYIYNLIKEE